MTLFGPEAAVNGDNGDDDDDDCDDDNKNSSYLTASMRGVIPARFSCSLGAPDCHRYSSNSGEHLYITISLWQEAPDAAHRRGQ